MRLDLAAYQRAFVAAILSGGASDLDRWPGFAVHRNTSTAGAIDALAASYARTGAILGDSEFRRLACAYFRDHSPTTPVLAEYGAGFVDWLEQWPQAAHPPWLVDVARIDRMQIEAHLSPDPDDEGGLVVFDISEEAWMNVVAVLHPATRFHWFATQAPSIWLASADMPTLNDVATIGVGGGLLLTRPRGAVQAYPIDRVDHQLLMGFRSGDSVGEIAISVACTCLQADIGASFKRLLESGAIHRFQLEEHEP